MKSGQVPFTGKAQRGYWFVMAEENLLFDHVTGVRAFEVNVSGRVRWPNHCIEIGVTSTPPASFGQKPNKTQQVLNS